MSLSWLAQTGLLTLSAHWRKVKSSLRLRLHGARLNTALTQALQYENCPYWLLTNNLSLASRLVTMLGSMESGKHQLTTLWSEMMSGASTVVSARTSSDFVTTRSRAPPLRCVGVKLNSERPARLNSTQLNWKTEKRWVFCQSAKFWTFSALVELSRVELSRALWIRQKLIKTSCDPVCSYRPIAACIDWEFPA